jgi:hypothetical protein
MKDECISLTGESSRYSLASEGSSTSAQSYTGEEFGNNDTGVIGDEWSC